MHDLMQLLVLHDDYLNLIMFDYKHGHFPKKKHPNIIISKR